MDKNFLSAQDVSDYMNISLPMAYKIIQKLNKELKSRGYITIAGKISRKYFEEKVYGAVHHDNLTI